MDKRITRSKTMNPPCQDLELKIAAAAAGEQSTSNNKSDTVDDTSTSSDSGNEENKRVRCPNSECFKSFSNETGLRYHLSASCGGVGKIFECADCGKKFSSKGSLRRHIEMMRATCSTGVRRRTVVSINASDPQLVQDAIVKCPKCKKKYMNKYSLGHHLRYSKCGSFWKFQCKFCLTNFNQKFAFKYHQQKCAMKNQSGTTEKVQCPRYSGTFKNKPSLANHLLITCQVARKFECDNCSMKFKRKGDLKRHLIKSCSKKKIATGRVQCPRCLGLFKNKPSLANHLRSTCEIAKKFECNNCSMKYKTKEHLKRHLIQSCSKNKIETEKSQCPRCSGTFKNKPSLANHLLSTCQIARKFECDNCSMKYKRKEHLKQHLIKSCSKKKIADALISSVSGMNSVLQNKSSTAPEQNLEQGDDFLHPSESDTVTSKTREIVYEKTVPPNSNGQKDDIVLIDLTEDTEVEETERSPILKPLVLLSPSSVEQKRLDKTSVVEGDWQTSCVDSKPPRMIDNVGEGSKSSLQEVELKNDEEKRVRERERRKKEIRLKLKALEIEEKEDTTRERKDSSLFIEPPKLIPLPSMSAWQALREEAIAIPTNNVTSGVCEVGPPDKDFQENKMDNTNIETGSGMSASLARKRKAEDEILIVDLSDDTEDEPNAKSNQVTSTIFNRPLKVEPETRSTSNDTLGDVTRFFAGQKSHEVSNTTGNRRKRQKTDGETVSQWLPNTSGSGSPTISSNTPAIIEQEHSTQEPEPNLLNLHNSHQMVNRYSIGSESLAMSEDTLRESSGSSLLPQDQQLIEIEKERIKIKREMEAVTLRLQLIEHQKKMEELDEEERRLKLKK